jgi:hypothetical protein
VAARKKPAEPEDTTLVETPLQETVSTPNGQEQVTARSDVDEPVTQSGVRISDVKGQANEIGLVVETEELENGRVVSGRTAVLTINGKDTVLSADDIGVLSNLAQSAFLETH